MSKDKNNKELTKEEKIKEEIKRLNKLFNKIEIKTKKAVSTLIENAAFMSISLAELQDIINVKGYTEKYKNGATQFGIKKCSEVELYNTMLKNHMTIMKQLTDLLPKQTKTTEDDGFEEFVINK